MRLRSLIPFVCLAALWAAPAAADDGWAEARAYMVRVIEAHADSLAPTPTTRLISPEVLDVMNSVPRHRFVPETYRDDAYADTPLPIGHGQTISQPFLVALMTELLDVGPEATVLEIGTGSGYQAAVLSPLVTEVCSMEIIAPLGESAAERLAALGYDNVRARIGDGYMGWPDCGPFDGITVTAAAGHVPPPLVQQLKPGGRMVIPVGDVYGPQYLTLVEKDAAGRVTSRQLLPVRFVPLTRPRE